MRPRISLITLGVDDLERSVAFYRDGLGFPTRGIVGTGFSLAHNVASQLEVDAVMAQAERAGARVVEPAGKAFWGGYAGYFQDPDGHLWEVAFNPDLEPLIETVVLRVDP